MILEKVQGDLLGTSKCALLSKKMQQTSRSSQQGKTNFMLKSSLTSRICTNILCYMNMKAPVIGRSTFVQKDMSSFTKRFHIGMLVILMIPNVGSY